MKTLLSTLFLLSCFMATTFAQTTVCYRINASSDDAEELQNGTMDLTSTDLDLVEDASSSVLDQTVGMRFNSVAVPQGANIIDAYIQFTVDETNSSSTSLIFRAEAADNPSTFVSTNGDISRRTSTLNTITWNPVPTWNSVGLSGIDQRTPDLSTVVQEIISRAGWNSGNSMVILVNGSGERTADSFNGGANNAPQICITYNTDPLPNGSICKQINSSTNDAEEIQDGSMYFNSTDIELIRDDNNGRGEQIIGLRFEDIQVPQGAVIYDAYLQFTVDESSTESTQVFIKGERVDNSAPFANTTNNISNRSTTFSRSWNIPDWNTVGESGLDQRSPDISFIIEEIVGRSGWQTGNALSIIINGSGQRIAEAFDGSPGQAPQLCFSYSTCPPTPPVADEDCFYFLDCNITNGGTLLVACDEDLSDEAIIARFAYTRSDDCVFCNSTKTPVLKRSRGTQRNNVKQDLSKNSNPSTSICYTEQIIWENLCLGDNNIVELSATLEVIDPSPPSFNVPGNVVLSCNDNPYDLEITGDISNLNDNCGIANICYEDDNDTPAINCTTGGSIIRTWRVTDECGNITSKTQLITINPSINCTTNCIQTICTEMCGDVVRLSCTDNTSDSAINSDFGGCLSSSCNPGATPIFSRTLISTGNTAIPSCGADYCVISRELLEWEFPSESFFLILEIIDDSSPSFTVPADVQVFCEEINDLSVTGNVNDDTDNCGATKVRYEDDQQIEDCDTETLITRSWIASDPCGNETVKKQLITVYPRGCNTNFEIDTIGGTFISEGNYFANTKTVSFAEVVTNTSVGLFGGVAVELLDGFHAKAGSTFRAAIVNCEQDIPLNDICEQAFNLTLNVPLNGDGINATKGDSYSLEDCFYISGEDEKPNPGVWFRFVSPITGTVEIVNEFDTEGDVDDISRLRVYEGSCNNLTFEDCSFYYFNSTGSSITIVVQDPILLDVETGKSYFIYLDNVYDIDVDEYSMLVSNASANSNHTPENRNSIIKNEQETLSTYPNPNYGKANINYAISTNSYVQIDLFDSKGNQVKNIISNYFEKGNYHVSLDEKNLSSGVYFVKMETNQTVLTRKIIIQ